MVSKLSWQTHLSNGIWKSQSAARLAWCFTIFQRLSHFWQKQKSPYSTQAKEAMFFPCYCKIKSRGALFYKKGLISYPSFRSYYFLGRHCSLWKRPLFPTHSYVLSLISMHLSLKMKNVKCIFRQSMIMLSAFSRSLLKLLLLHREEDRKTCFHISHVLLK